MKRKRKGKFAASVGGISLLVVFVYLFIATPSIESDEIFITQNREVFDVPVVEVQEEIPDELSEVFCDTFVVDGSCVTLLIESVIPEQPKIAESNDDVQEQIEDIFGGIDSVGIETVSVIYDLAGNTASTSTLFATPLALESDEGFFPDNVQVAFFALSSEIIVSLNLEGKVDFFLDDEKIETRHLWASSSVIGGTDKISLIVTDSEGTPPLSNRPETFDFTFTDEFIDPVVSLSQADFEIQKAGYETNIKEFERLIGIQSGRAQDRTEVQLKNAEKGLQDLIDRQNRVFDHKFRVIITELSGTINNSDFSWDGEFIAYELELKLDEQKVTVVNQDNEVVSIFKSDSTISSCSRSEYALEKVFTSNRQSFRFNLVVPATTALELTVFDSDGIEIGKIEEFTTDEPGTPKRNSRVVNPVLDCQTINIMRDGEYTIRIDDRDFEIKAPVTQQNYFVQYENIDARGDSAKINLNTNCKVSLSNQNKCDPRSRPSWDMRPLQAIYEQATSNFGFEYNTVPCDGALYAMGAQNIRDEKLDRVFTIDDLPESIKANCQR